MEWLPLALDKIGVIVEEVDDVINRHGVYADTHADSFKI